ncbi:hypothetical protein G7Y89_g10949 [Cudoniella acicularis]|uniref:Uncharacterized protein n=1 Tax=Cudoniella acicularis TaxID=354080 RepID=A0A8H4RFE8_9HELO|nr:hypothetical protein G7Y89_g10949 [Cudoniella acicularis]
MPRAELLDDEPEVVEAALEEHPTDSHELANADHEEKGAAKFNKQMYHIKALPEPLLGGLDLNIAGEEEFSPDKLRANIERLYMTAIADLVRFWKHIARLRSWRERNRTIAFLVVYSVAWLLDFLVPTIIAFVMILIVYPPARTYCFPPTPTALINSKTGGVKKPTAGVLGSDNSLTGAPEKHQGEAVEQEASNFVKSFTSIAISSAAGKRPQGDPHSEEEGVSALEDTAPDPTNMAMSAADAKDRSSDGQPNAVHDKTKEPTAGKDSQMLSPTAPFPKEKPRIKLAAVLAPVLLVSMFTSSYMFMKMNGFFIGFGFFGDPLIWRALSYLNREFPHWQKLLEIRNTLLKGVPTNAQLTITLLRIGEANKAPLPPPPYSRPPPPNAAHETAGQSLEHLEGVPDAAVTTGAEKLQKKQHGRRLIAAMKSVTKGGMETILGTDHLKAGAGAEHAKNRLGVLRSGPASAAGPIGFPARYRGKKGHAYITTMVTSPALSWTTEKEDIDPVFSIAIADIQEIKKVCGLG